MVYWYQAWLDIGRSFFSMTESTEAIKMPKKYKAN